jgi:hypothetical protein
MYGSLLVGSDSSSVVRSTSRRSVFDAGKVGAVLFGEAIGSIRSLPEELCGIVPLCQIEVPISF